MQSINPAAGFQKKIMHCVTTFCIGFQNVMSDFNKLQVSLWFQWIKEFGVLCRDQNKPIIWIISTWILLSLASFSGFLLYLDGFGQAGFQENNYSRTDTIKQNSKSFLHFDFSYFEIPILHKPSLNTNNVKTYREKNQFVLEKKYSTEEL